MPPIITSTATGIRQAADLVQSGGLIAYPTETVYGLGVDPFNPDALRRLYTLKQRDASRPLILLVTGPNDLTRLVTAVSADARGLIEAFWPGALTLVFHAALLPEGVASSAGTIALRQSGSQVAQSLLDLLTGPLTSTSANRHGMPPAQSAEEVADALGEEVDLILDGGVLGSRPPSTLVDLTSTPPAILRKGPITAEQVRDILDQTRKGPGL